MSGQAKISDSFHVASELVILSELVQLLVVVVVVVD